MQYYYRLEAQGKWIGPYAEGRLCLFDAAWAAHLSQSHAEALAVPLGMDPITALNAGRAISATVPLGKLISNIKDSIYEPPSEWIVAADDDDDSFVATIQQTQRLKRGLSPQPRRASDIIVRPATMDDVQDMTEVQQRAYASYLRMFTPHQINEMFETVEDMHRALEDGYAYVAVDDTSIRGLVRAVVRRGVAIIPSVSVDPTYAGHGIGTVLVETVEECVREEVHKLYTESPLLGYQALRFFLGLGYEPAAILRRHYNGLDWVAFEKFVD